MRIAAISDVHGKWNRLVVPECDLLISAGDYSFKGERHMTRDFHKWLNKQKAGSIISVMGNHELIVQQNFNESKEIARQVCPRVRFMEEGALDIGGFKIWCSAWTPWFMNWAYNANRGTEIARHWSFIPDETNILITHGPPYGILDVVYDANEEVPDENVGCVDLMNRINQLKELKLHVFGHIHGSSGEVCFNGVKYINAAICNEIYQPTNPVRYIEL